MTRTGITVDVALVFNKGDSWARRFRDSKKSTLLLANVGFLYKEYLDLCLMYLRYPELRSYLDEKYLGELPDRFFKPMGAALYLVLHTKPKYIDITLAEHLSEEGIRDGGFSKLFLYAQNNEWAWPLVRQGNVTIETLDHIKSSDIDSELLSFAIAG